MTIYQAELLRRLPQLDCTGYYGYRDGLLHIFHGDDPFCRQTPEGFLRFYEDQFEALSQTELYHRNMVNKFSGNPGTVWDQSLC